MGKQLNSQSEKEASGGALGDDCVGLTVGSIAFWKVFFGCIWLVGIVAMGVVSRGYSSVVVAFLCPLTGMGHIVSVVVATILWPPLLLLDVVVVLVVFAFVSAFGTVIDFRTEDN